MVGDADTLLPPPVRSEGANAAATLTILYHPDLTRIGERARLDTDTELSRTTPLFTSTLGTTRPLDDRYVSRAPLWIKPVSGGVSLEADLSKRRLLVDGEVIVGTWRKHFDRAALDFGIVIELAERIVLLLHLALPPRFTAHTHGLVGESDAIARVREDIDRVGDLDVPILLRGETGTGKELVASALHAAGGGTRPFIGVNIAALPPITAASELFGHTKGSFTGAIHDRDGLFVSADGGTLFLDEIGETPLDVQSMLLRVLETSEVTPLGGSRGRRIAVRVIAATDADLETQIAESAFRSALYHRLAGFQLVVPPLRERRDDVGRLLLHFLRGELASTGDLARVEHQHQHEQLWLPAPLVARFARFTWPGNVRQLRNAVRQLVIASRAADEARIDPVLDRLLATKPVPVEAPTSPPTKRRDLSEITDDDLFAALRGNQWRAAGAAAQLGVSRSTLYHLIDRSKRIRKARDIDEAELRRAIEATSGDVEAAAAELEVSPRALKLRIAELGKDTWWGHDGLATIPPR